MAKPGPIINSLSQLIDYQSKKMTALLSGSHYAIMHPHDNHPLLGSSPRTDKQARALLLSL